MEDEKRRVLDDEKRRVLDDEKTRGLTIQEMWTDVSDRFEAETGMSLRLKPAKTLRDCIDAVEKRQLPPAASESKAAVSGAEKAKSFGLDVLHCLKLLGGVAAQGADMVRLPARPGALGGCHSGC